jgi:hypothetical protein
MVARVDRSPSANAVAPRAVEVIRDCCDAAGAVAESMTFMVETRTPACQTLREVRRPTWTAPRRVADVACRHGAVTVASWELVDPLVAQVRPRLSAHGDEAIVLTVLDQALIGELSKAAVSGRRRLRGVERWT